MKTKLHFGVHVKDRRKVKKLSLRELSHKSGVQYTKIFHIENGRIPRLDDAIRLERTLGDHLIESYARELR